MNYLMLLLIIPIIALVWCIVSVFNHGVDYNKDEKYFIGEPFYPIIPLLLILLHLINYLLTNLIK